MTEGKPETTRDYGKKRPKVPAFARYAGTSAWRKDKRKVRAYAMHLARAAAQETRVSG